MSSTMNNDNGDLRDEALRRALLNAPDHTATPNWRLRKAILDHAHEAVTPFAAAAEPEEAAARPWWQRLLGLGGRGGGARMPWNAAFATVLVGVLVAVLWQREPVPGARPDSEGQVSTPAQRSEAPAAPASPPPAAPAPAPAPPPQAAKRALPSSEDIPGGPAPVTEPAGPDTAAAPAKGARPAARPAERPAPTPAPSELARRPDDAALSASAAATAKEARKKEAATPAGERMRSEEESASRQRFGAPASPAPGAGAARDAAEPAREARAAAPPAPTGSPEPPSFSALSQWSRITITQRGGASRTLSRSEAQDLNALLGSAAISAVGAQPLAGTPEWRVTLERSNGDVMATFELGRNQVRWREGRGAAATGMPSASSLSALREALQHAVEPPAQPSPPQLQFKPQQPAESETAPAAPTR